MMMSTKSYSELSKLKTFEERFEYLKLNGVVGDDTFGYERYLNQIFYKSPEWRKVRDEVIVRDNGCDLGIIGREIGGRILVHHLNPVSLEDIQNRHPSLFDPENLISVSHLTHNAIHYGSQEILIKDPIERTKNDTCPWK